jgi:hypothetical protein
MCGRGAFRDTFVDKAIRKGACGVQKAGHDSDIQGRLVPHQCDPGKALTLGFSTANVDETRYVYRSSP